ncbi:DUF1648 domain-containing protein [Agromyces sp. PvR057]|uniref:DUF1648 domain-containing protein n=1 Tax=Agromyces sp. PvR057 TaxID=3156403 RepID=UPI000E2261BD
MTDPTAVTPADLAERRRDRRILAAVVIWIPLAIIAVATIILVLWIPRLPEQVAIHFDAAGQADRWTSPSRAVLAFVAVSVSVTAAIAIACFGGARAMMRPADGRPSRLLARVRPTASFGPAVATLLAVVTLALTGAQLDGAVPSSWVAAVAVGGGILFAGLVGWVTWRALPEPERTAADAPAATPALDLSPGEVAVWTATASAPWPVFVLIGLALAVVLVPLVLVPEAWWLWGVLLVVLLVLATTAWIRVTVDRRGLTVRTILGFRLSHVPLAEVVSAADVDVLPAEFGGWGLRLDVRGRRGIILRSGEGLEVERADAPPLVVTVPDARTGAALLNALAGTGR